MTTVPDTLSETDTGPRRLSGTERMCALTREVKPIAEMIRFVLDPEGAVVPDVKRKLPGRGVWVTATAEAVGQAVARNVFARGFKKPVRASTELPELTRRLLGRAALDALAIANKAGLVQTGFAKVEIALARGDVVALLHTTGAAPDGVRKLAAAARRHAAGTEQPVEIDWFTGEELALALGRSNVVHAAVLAGTASELFLSRCRGFEAFRGSVAEEKPAA